MNTVIFDLDGTLLPMPSQELFLEEYFKALSIKLIPYGLDPHVITKAIWAGIAAMIKNDGTMSNEQRFWEIFCGLTGKNMEELEPMFMEFYQNEFAAAKNAVSHTPVANLCIQELKEKGYQMILATNPVFPQIATYARMEWAGLNPKDFELITTYENSSYCKPNLKYYEEILRKISRKPQDCIMIGNDVKEDMCVSLMGMDTFLLTDCLIHEKEDDLTLFKQGDFQDLYDMIHNFKILK